MDERLTATRRDMVARFAAGDATVNELAEPFDAPPEKVFRAHTDPELFAHSPLKVTG